MGRFTSRYLSILTGKYKNFDYFTKRKAEYAVLLTSITLFVMLITIILETIIVGFTLYDLIVFLVFIISFIVIIFVFSRGKLELGVNMLIVGATIRMLIINYSSNAYQLFTMFFLTGTIVAIIHIKNYQMITVHIVNVGLIAYKVVSYGKIVYENNEDIRMFTQVLYSSFIYFMFIFVSYFIVNIVNREIQKSHQLTESANTDQLTGLYNRRYFYEYIDGNLEIKSDFWLAILDLDNFKVINDKFGHNTGDKVLMNIGHILENDVEETISFRWGGEEFLIISSVNEIEFLAFLDKARDEIEKIDLNSGWKVTGSFGYTEYIYGESIDKTVQRADMALYNSKVKGKNIISKM